jgi:hypothetical protein
LPYSIHSLDKPFNRYYLIGVLFAFWIGFHTLHTWHELSDFFFLSFFCREILVIFFLLLIYIFGYSTLLFD